MKEKFVVWNAKPGSLKRLEVIDAVLADYGRMGIRLTLRQLYYQLVSKNVMPNQQREYKRLGELLSNARLGGLVDWDVIEDRVRAPRSAGEADNIKDVVDYAVAGFRLRRWDAQPEYVELWCEKDALSSVLEPIVADLHVTLMVNRGYSSSTAMYDSAKRIERKRKGRRATVIYLGDFDPSGEDMVRDIDERFRTFGVDVNVSKLALTPHQVEHYKLPPNPAKLSDSRSPGFIARHGDESFEVDALPPEELQRLVRSAIEGRMDLKKYAAVKGTEDRQRARLTKMVNGLNL